MRSGAVEALPILIEDLRLPFGVTQRFVDQRRPDKLRMEANLQYFVKGILCMDQQEQDIKMLLKAINDELESTPIDIDYVFFYNDKSKNTFLNRLSFDHEYLCRLLDICERRKQIEKINFQWLDHTKIWLTPAGQEKALSDNDQEKIPPINIIFNGPTQVGNGNIQNFSDFISIIEAKINEAPVAESEKEEAKTLLQKISDNQLASQSIASAIGAIIGDVVNSLCK